MIVTCPQCAKRYMLDEGLVPPEGRQVRCITCHHVWRQIPDILSPLPHSVLIGPGDISLQTTVANKKIGGWRGWILSLLILLLGVSTFVFGRSFIVTYWPMSEKFYELIGLPVVPLGSGLSIANATSQLYQEGNLEMVRVMGNIINNSENVRHIPPLKIKLMGNPSDQKCKEQSNPADCILDQWEHRLSAQSLLPGEKIQFETDPRPKIQGSHHIRVEF